MTRLKVARIRLNNPHRWSSDTRKIEQWFTNLDRSGRLNGDGEARIDLHALNLEPPARPKPRITVAGKLAD